MSEPQEETRRVQFLLTNLVILTLVILGLITLVAIYPRLTGPKRSPQQTSSAAALLPPTDTPTITPSPTLTRTPRPTLTPSITPTASETPIPSLTPTLPGPPTLTPAMAVFSDPYTLADWGPEQADHAAALMHDLPNTWLSDPNPPDAATYYDAFSYAAIAQREALLRFPDAPQAQQWQWQLAFNLARTGSPQAGQAYADLITSALNSAEVELKDLPDWFAEHEPLLELKLTPLDPPSGYTGSSLIEISGPGSAFMRLLETPGAYQALVLASNFDFVNGPASKPVIADLTGDGDPELAVSYSPPATLTLQTPAVFSLGEVITETLGFRPSDETFLVGMDYPNTWVAGSTGKPELWFESRMFPACPVIVRRGYAWDGAFFTFTGAEYDVEPEPATFSLCRYLVDHAAEMWGPQAAIEIMQPLLADWPPPQDESGEPFPADAKDEWRFRLGIYHALTGDSQTAIQTMTELVKQPSSTSSRYIAPAQAFLQTYKQPEDIYKACLSAPFCSPTRALDYLLNQHPIPPGQDALEFLTQNGATLRAQAYFDFDKDGQAERWFTLRHRPLEKLEMWVLAEQADGFKALLAGDLEGSAPQLTYLDDEKTPPVVLRDGIKPLMLLRDPDTAEPYLYFPVLPRTFPDRFQPRVDALANDLLNGVDPATVRDELLALVDEIGLLCKTQWTCDSYYYFLGLAYELAGDERPAIDTFKRLWLDYSKSPFTTLARLKLQPTITPPTPIATITPTLSPLLTPPTPLPFTLTPTLSLTPTRTSTPGPSPTPTPTPTTRVYPGVTTYP